MTTTSASGATAPTGPTGAARRTGATGPTDVTEPVPTSAGPPHDPSGAMSGGEERGPQAYHRLAHLDERTARWWRPLAVLGVGSGLLLLPLVVLVVAAVVAVVLDAAAPDLLPVWPSASRPSPDLDDPRNPVDQLLGLGAIALLLPLVVLALRWGGGQRGLVHSVAGRFRWRLALRAGAVVLPVHAVVLAALVLLVPADDLSTPPLDLSLAAVLGVVLVMTPLQCAAEEYAFRGLPQQLLGTWLRRPVWGVVLPVPLFMAGHGYGWVGQVDVAAFALAAGVLVWKSGGLELAVVLHLATNLPLFLLSPLSPTSLQQGDVDPRLLLVSLPLTLATTAALVVWVSRTHGVGLLEPVRGRGRAPAVAPVRAGAVA
ncbi:CPBP family intramembrane glutamic endopeptidase [uncultured Pseudokineococcus sp.]|uniref:CPBP family intramembrane glutamic endopeptidase n=1 Tax=uncultured Pseudokineococcus sp. TaxID=1642928 RepID=UPI002625FB26|nr:CPBP family intramembrane glutamic endopeptidase [uncultured Pseudokineococcus sp.]